MAYTYGDYGYAKDSSNNYIKNGGKYVYQIRLGYELQSQNINNNTSIIKLQLEVRSVDSAYKTYGYNQTTTIDGTSLSAKTFDFRSTNSWQIFGTREITVEHNADGTYSVNKSASFTTTATGTGRPHSGSASVQVILPTIPRASQITVNDANIGSSTNIVINKASDSFTTTLRYKAFDENNWTTIVEKTANQVYGWTVPTSFYSKIPNSQTMTCEFQAETFSGDTSVGTSTYTATFTATGNPVINSASATDINSTTATLTGDSSKMIIYASNVQISISASGQNSASISSIYVNGNNVSGGSITFNNANTNVFNIVVIDSRGYQTGQTITMTMVDYIPLTINASITRHTPTDGKVDINVSGNYFNGSFGSQSNSLTVQYRYKESTSSTWENWTNLSVTASGNSYSGTTQLTNMDYTKSYNFEVQAIDSIQTKQIVGITVTRGIPVFNWDNDEFDVNVTTKVNDLQSSAIEMFGQTPYIDFYYNNSTSDYTSRIIEAESGVLAIPYNLKVEGQFKRYFEMYSNGTTCNFDNITAEGYYNIKPEATQLNGPVSTNVDGIMEVKIYNFDVAGKCIVQELFNFNDQTWYKRIYWYEVFWTGWVALN